MMLKVRLLEGASAESLALGRLLVLAIWAVYVITDPIQRLTLIPIELFHPHGVFAAVPGSFWAALITPAGLLGLKAAILAAIAWAAFGFAGARVATGFLVVAGLIYLQVKKGFGGHWDHREMSLVYITALLLISPAWDAFAVRRDAHAAQRRPGSYRAALLVACLIIIVQYVFIGAARLFIGGPGVFMDGTLQKWIENRNLRPNPFGFDVGTLFLDPFWSVPLDLLFIGGTLLEIAVIALLFLKPSWLWAKLLLIVGFVAFHGSIFLLMNVAFPEDVALLLLFFNLAAPLNAMRRGHTEPGVLSFDAGVPRATSIAQRTRARATAVDVVDKGGATGGLEFATSDAVVSGEEARTEVMYRWKGYLVVAWLRHGVLRRSGPIKADRGPIGTWFLGSMADESRAG